MPKLDNPGDFTQWLGPDLSIKILTDLDNPSDLVRASSASKLWFQFVVQNALCRELFLKKFPELSSVALGFERNDAIEPVKVSDFSLRDEWNYLKRKHRLLSFLAHGLSTVISKKCILYSIRASSTDNDPEESIQNTLEVRDRIRSRASYWSSKGESDPAAPEALLYKLVANLCVVTEIHIQPFQAYFQHGLPIYSCKAVRFKVGHLRYPLKLGGESADSAANEHILTDNMFAWTYTSPEFPVAQENKLQKFELPEPVLCIGGLLILELLGRVQRQDIDGLYYICISHVQVVGRPLTPAYDIEMLMLPEGWVLKYYPNRKGRSG